MKTSAAFSNNGLLHIVEYNSERDLSEILCLQAKQYLTTPGSTITFRVQQWHKHIRDSIQSNTIKKLKGCKYIHHYVLI